MDEDSEELYLERAIHQILYKAPAPEVDLTQHQLENGSTISTQERVVKEVSFADLPTRMLLHVWDRCKHP